VLYSYEKFLTELGRKLRQLRIDRGLTLRAMIIRHGFHLAQWQGFEKGKGISVPSLLRMCEVFDLKLEELVGGMGVADSGHDSSASAALAVEPVCEPPKTPKRRTGREASNSAKASSSASSDPSPRHRKH